MNQNDLKAIHELSIEDLEFDIALRIFNFHIFYEKSDGKRYVSHNPYRHEWQELPKYARDIVAAKAATDAMLQRGWTMDLESFLTTEGEPTYNIRLQYLRKQANGDGWFVADEVTVATATEEEARARAALMAHYRNKEQEKS